MIEVEGDGGCDADGGEEGVGAAVIAHGHPPPVLQASEHVLDLVALTVESLVVRNGDLAAAAGGDAGLNAFLQERLTEAVAVVALSAIRVEAGGDLPRVQWTRLACHPLLSLFRCEIPEG